MRWNRIAFERWGRFWLSVALTLLASSGAPIGVVLGSAGDADFGVGVTVDHNNLIVPDTLQMGVFPQYNPGNPPVVDAQNVVMTLKLPAGFNYFSTGQVAPGWNCVTPAVGQNGTISCSKATVSPGENVFFNFAATVASCQALSFSFGATIFAPNLTTNGGLFTTSAAPQMTCVGLIATATLTPSPTGTATNTPAATPTGTATTSAGLTPTPTGTAGAGATPTSTRTPTVPTGASPTPVIPEAPPLWLFASGLLALGGLAARRRRR